MWLWWRDSAWYTVQWCDGTMAMMRWSEDQYAMVRCNEEMAMARLSKYVNLHDRASLYYPCSIDISHLIVPLSLHHFQRDIASSGHRTIASLHCHIIVIAPSRYRSIDPDLDGAIVHPDSIPGRNGTSKLVENLFTKRHLRIQEW